MDGTTRMHSPQEFSRILYEQMIPVAAGIEKLALYEFRYALGIYIRKLADSIKLETQEEIERTHSDP
jgi:hypothetical protein